MPPWSCDGWVGGRGWSLLCVPMCAYAMWSLDADRAATMETSLMSCGWSFFDLSVQQVPSMDNRGATDRRWSVIRTDQSPRFGTHVIRGLTDKFNHHRVKVYHLHVLRFLRSAAAAHTEARTRWEREWEREAWFRYRVSDNASTDGYIHTHKVMLKYPFWQVFW